MIEKPKRWL